LRRARNEQLSYDNPKSGPGGSGPQILTPLKLLDRLAAVVPPPRVHRHRYFGSRPTHRCAQPSPPSRW